MTLIPSHIQNSRDSYFSAVPEPPVCPATDVSAGVPGAANAPGKPELIRLARQHLGANSSGEGYHPSASLDDGVNDQRHDDRGDSGRQRGVHARRTHEAAERRAREQERARRAARVRAQQERQEQEARLARDRRFIQARQGSSGKPERPSTQPPRHQHTHRSNNNRDSAALTRAKSLVHGVVCDDLTTSQMSAAVEASVDYAARQSQTGEYSYVADGPRTVTDPKIKKIISGIKRRGQPFDDPEFLYNSFPPAVIKQLNQHPGTPLASAVQCHDLDLDPGSCFSLVVLQSVLDMFLCRRVVLESPGRARHFARAPLRH